MNTEKYVASNISQVPPSGIRKFFDIASTMKDAISLGVGEPDFVTPWNVREVAIHSIEKGRTNYTSNHGLEELRSAICEYHEKKFDTKYKLEECFITVGASEALDLAFRAIINPGDEVLIPAPSYVSYFPGVRFAGGVPVAVDTFEEDNFILTPQNIKKVITNKTKAIVLPFPNNPTGAIMTAEQLDAIKPIIIEHELLVISDEIYAELTYGSTHASFASGMEDRTILVGGFSKAFAMTGWRLGYAMAPLPVLDAMVKIHQYSILCAPIVSQDAAHEALIYEMSNGFAQVKSMVASYNRRRLLILEGLRELGLSCFEPKGAFYVFPNIKSTGMTSDEFCEGLLMKHKVACVPGTAFGSGGEGFIRCSYASSVDNIKEAIKRIGNYLKEIENAH